MTPDRASKNLFVFAFLTFAAASPCAAQIARWSDLRPSNRRHSRRGFAPRQAQRDHHAVWHRIRLGLAPTAAGEIASGSTRTLLPLQISFDQTPVEVTYEGLAPGFVGLYQFDVVVPSIPDNDLVPLKLTLDTVAGAQTLYIAVHQ